MTSRKRNLSIIALVVALLAAAVTIIVTKPTVLGLDLRGGVELVYEGRPTPQVPEVTPQAIDDAIETIRKRTDALGVSEPEIQRAGANQISIGLPNVSNADRAIDQVGTTAQLQFYDWEPNVITEGDRGPDSPFSGSRALFNAVTLASKSKPKAEATDIPPGGPSKEIEQRFNGDKKEIQRYYDRRNDTSKAEYYLFGADNRLIAGPDSNCQELLADFEGVEGPPREPGEIPKGSECEKELAEVPVGNAKSQRPGQDEQQVDTKTGPPKGSQVLEVPQGIVVIEAQRQPNQPDTIQNFYVLEDDSELSGSDIKKPEVSPDSNRGPAVSMQFTGEGQRAFARATKREAQRGSEIILPPGANPEEREAAQQRSRSRWTTGSSRWPRSTSARTRRASTARPAPRSPASTASRRPRTWPRTCASARCRSS